MIWPKTTVSAEIHIHAARLTVWEKFTGLSTWPQWYPDLQSAQWEGAHGWQEGGHFTLQQGIQRHRYLIRMVSVGKVTVWEAEGGMASVVYSANFSDQLGGCKVSLQGTYHGFGALANLFQPRHQNHQLRQWLEGLKRWVERT